MNTSIYNKNLSNQPPPQTDHSPISMALFGSQTLAHTIQFYLPKLTTYLNGPFKDDPHGRSIWRYRCF